jgi:tRNA-dihydrouridine synthase B
MHMITDLFTKKLMLAPMAGVTDRVFRAICRGAGADVVFSEMVSAEGVCRCTRNTAPLVAFDPQERPIGIQLFGAEPQRMAEAARIVAAENRPDFIDINAGCPVHKVVSKNGGSALLKDAVQFQKIVAAVVAAVDIPVTVKIRSGWDSKAFVDQQFAHIAQESGVAAVTLHARTKAMGFSGHAIWERIALVKQAVSIPVIGNGDIVTPQDGVRMFQETGCDSIMIGRGALGAPWLFGQIRASLQEAFPTGVTHLHRYTTALNHLESFRSLYGEVRAAKEMKKHLAWYTKNMPAAGGLRKRFFTSHTTAELEAILRNYFSLQAAG